MGLHAPQETFPLMLVGPHLAGDQPPLEVHHEDGQVRERLARLDRRPHEQQREGFLRCVKMTAPKSLPALLGLPTPFLDQALTKFPDLLPPLQRYASNPAVFASTPQSTLSLLKLLNR